MAGFELMALADHPVPASAAAACINILAPPHETDGALFVSEPSPGPYSEPHPVNWEEESPGDNTTGAKAALRVPFLYDVKVICRKSKVSAAAFSFCLWAAWRNCFLVI